LLKLEKAALPFYSDVDEAGITTTSTYC